MSDVASLIIYYGASDSRNTELNDSGASPTYTIPDEDFDPGYVKYEWNLTKPQDTQTGSDVASKIAQNQIMQGVVTVNGTSVDDLQSKLVTLYQRVTDEDANKVIRWTPAGSTGITEYKFVAGNFEGSGFNQDLWRGFKADVPISFVVKPTATSTTETTTSGVSRNYLTNALFEIDDNGLASKWEKQIDWTDTTLIEDFNGPLAGATLWTSSDATNFPVALDTTNFSETTGSLKCSGKAYGVTTDGYGADDDFNRPNARPVMDSSQSLGTVKYVNETLESTAAWTTTGAAADSVSNDWRIENNSLKLVDGETVQICYLYGQDASNRNAWDKDIGSQYGVVTVEAEMSSSTLKSAATQKVPGIMSRFNGTSTGYVLCMTNGLIELRKYVTGTPTVLDSCDPKRRFNWNPKNRANSRFRLKFSMYDSAAAGGNVVINCYFASETTNWKYKLAFDHTDSAAGKILSTVATRYCGVFKDEGSTATQGSVSFYRFIQTTGQFLTLTGVANPQKLQLVPLNPDEPILEDTTNATTYTVGTAPQLGPFEGTLNVYDTTNTNKLVLSIPGVQFYGGSTVALGTNGVTFTKAAHAAKDFSADTDGNTTEHLLLDYMSDTAGQILQFEFSEDAWSTWFEVPLVLEQTLSGFKSVKIPLLGALKSDGVTLSNYADFNAVTDVRFRVKDIYTNVTIWLDNLRKVVNSEYGVLSCSDGIQWIEPKGGAELTTSSKIRVYQDIDIAYRDRKDFTAGTTAIGGMLNICAKYMNNAEIEAGVEYINSSGAVAATDYFYQFLAAGRTTDTSAGGYITAISRTSDIVTVTTNSAHSLSAADVVTIEGTPVMCDGTYTLLTASGSTMTFTLAGDDFSSTVPVASTAYVYEWLSSNTWNDASDYSEVIDSTAVKLRYFVDCKSSSGTSSSMCVGIRRPMLVNSPAAAPTTFQENRTMLPGRFLISGTKGEADYGFRVLDVPSRYMGVLDDFDETNAVGTGKGTWQESQSGIFDIARDAGTTFSAPALNVMKFTTAATAAQKDFSTSSTHNQRLDKPVYEKFVATGTNTVYSVVVWLTDIRGIGMYSGRPVRVSIHNDTAGSPGSLIEMSGTRVQPEHVKQGKQQAFMFTFTGAALTSGTTYWLKVRHENDSSLGVCTNATADANADMYVNRKGALTAIADKNIRCIIGASAGSYVEKTYAASRESLLNLSRYDSLRFRVYSATAGDLMKVQIVSISNNNQTVYETIGTINVDSSETSKWVEKVLPLKNAKNRKSAAKIRYWNTTATASATWYLDSISTSSKGVGRLKIGRIDQDVDLVRGAREFQVHKGVYIQDQSIDGMALSYTPSSNETGSTQSILTASYAFKEATNTSSYRGSYKVFMRLNDQSGRLMRNKLRIAPYIGINGGYGSKLGWKWATVFNKYCYVYLGELEIPSPIYPKSMRGVQDITVEMLADGDAPTSQVRFEHMVLIPTKEICEFESNNPNIQITENSTIHVTSIDPEVGAYLEPDFTSTLVSETQTQTPSAIPVYQFFRGDSLTMDTTNTIQIIPEGTQLKNIGVGTLAEYSAPLGVVMDCFVTYKGKKWL